MVLRSCDLRVELIKPIITASRIQHYAINKIRERLAWANAIILFLLVNGHPKTFFPASFSRDSRLLK